MSDPKSRDEQFMTEHMRQTAAYSVAIDEAIQQTGKEFECPLINSVAAAIVIAEAQLLASVGNPDARQALHDAMNNLRPEAYARMGANMKIDLIIRQEDGALQ